MAKSGAMVCFADDKRVCRDFPDRVVVRSPRSIVKAISCFLDQFPIAPDPMDQAPHRLQ